MKPDIEMRSSSNSEQVLGVNIMKRVLLASTITFAVAQIAFAQNSATGSVPLAATVIQGLTTAISGQCNFGTIVAGTTPNALSAQTGTVGSSSGNIAEITVTGNGGNQVNISFGTQNLTGTGNAITFTPSVYGNSSNTQTGASQITTATSKNLSGATGSAGNYYFWIGGSLSALPANQAPGTYSGTWTLTVSYP